MKQSMFLFLLLFTLSISVDFKIKKKPGLYLWNISENENENPKYERIFHPNSANVVISESSYPALDIPGSSSTKQSTGTSILNTVNTYIILKISDYCEFSLFYWVGAQSSENKILTAIPEVKLKLFHREAEGAESRLFRCLFKLPKPEKTLRLYRIAGSRGQFIMEVPAVYSELNGSDSFVLDKVVLVLNWNSLHSNEYKIRHAKLLVDRILETERFAKPVFLWVTESNSNIKRRIYNRFKKEFFKDLEDVPEPWQFPQIQTRYSDIQLEKKRREELKLYAYSWSFNRVTEKPIQWTVLKLDILRENDAYVLVDSYLGNIFAFLGKYADTEQIKMCLSAAEKFSKTIGVEDAWQRVKVFLEDETLPINVQIYFNYEP